MMEPLGRLRANVFRDGDELFWNVACRTALIPTRLDMVDGALPVESGSDTANAETDGPVQISKLATVDLDGPAVE